MSEEILRLLRGLKEDIKRLNEKMDIILKGKQARQDSASLVTLGNLESDSPLDVTALLSLTDHLRKTAMVMLELEQANAEMVAERTGRRRATESDCLNQLVRMGYLQKRREGLKVFFSI